MPRSLSGVINSFVHIIMYTYYLLAALLPQYQKYLWWKKYITTLQMVRHHFKFSNKSNSSNRNIQTDASRWIEQGQFCLAFLHSCQLLIYDCDYPKWSLILILPNAMFFYFLFADFYSSAYKHDEKRTKSTGARESRPAKRMTNGNTENGKGKTD